MILLFILIMALLAIWIGYQLTHPPKMQDPAQEEGETFTFTVRVPMGEYPEGTELTPWKVLEMTPLEEGEEQE